MGVHAVTGQDGLWSMRQARDLLAIPERTARDICDRGLLPRTNLPHRDLLALQVLAAAAAHPYSSDPDVRRLRDRDLVDLARRSFAEPSGERVIVLTPSDASYADDNETLLLLLRRWQDRSPTVLPVGRWAQVLRERIAPGAAA